MRRKVLCLATVLCATAFSIFLSLAVNPASADSTSTRELFFDPASTWISAVAEFDSTTIAISYDDTGLSPGVRGFHIVITFDPECIQITDIVPGALIDSYQSHFEYSIDDVNGELLFDIVVLGATGGVTGAGSIADITVTALDQLVDCCTALSFDSISSILRDPDNATLSTNYTDGSISHDITPPEAALLASTTHTESIYTAANDVRVHWATTEDYGLCPAGVLGYYLLLDQDPLGIPDPVSTFDSFTPWSIDSTEYVTWFADVADGTWYVHIVSYDLVGNASTIDTFGPVNIEATPPESITGFTAITTDNSDLSIDLTWINPTEHFVGTKLFRQQYGNYPEYDDPPAPGSEPAWPADPAAALSAGWVEVYDGPGVSFVDHPATRDFYYYTAFAYNNVPLYSASAASAQGSCLDYWLGDFAVGGSETVDIHDVLYFSLAYSTSEGDPTYNSFCDIGPTVDYSRTNRPTTDNEINFYDLLLIAWNYENTSQSKNESRETCYGFITPSLAVTRQGNTLEARVNIKDNPGCLLGASARLDFGPELEYIGASIGGLWHGVENFFIDSKKENFVLLDAVGLGETAENDGCFAITRFRIVNPHADSASLLKHSIALGRFMAAGENGEDLGGLYLAQDIPVNYGDTRGSLQFSASPNPTRGGAAISYQVAASAPVRIAIYDTSGRLVRTLIDQVQAAGHHSLNWDGQTETGNGAPPGIYFIRKETGEVSSTRKLIVVK